MAKERKCWKGGKELIEAEDQEKYSRNFEDDETWYMCHTCIAANVEVPQNQASN